MKPTNKTATQLKAQTRQLAAKTKLEDIEKSRVDKLTQKIGTNGNQFCNPAKKDNRGQPVNDCKTRLNADLRKLYDNNRASTDERKTEIVNQLKTVLLNLIPTTISGANFKPLLDNTVLFNMFFKSLINNKYKDRPLFKDENEYANVGGSSEFKEFYEKYKNPQTENDTTSDLTELPQLQPTDDTVGESTHPVVNKFIPEDQNNDSSDNRDINPVSSEPDNSDVAIEQENPNDKQLIPETVAAPIPNRLNIELHATAEGVFVKILTETENQPSNSEEGYEGINTTNAMQSIKTKFTDEKFKSFLTAFNVLYVNTSKDGVETSGIMINIIIVDNAVLKIKIDPIATPDPLNTDSGFTKITKFDPSTEQLNTIIDQIPPDFLKIFHTAYNTPPL